MQLSLKCIINQRLTSFRLANSYMRIFHCKLRRLPASGMFSSSHEFPNLAVRRHPWRFGACKYPREIRRVHGRFSYDSQPPWLLPQTFWFQRHRNPWSECAGLHSRHHLNQPTRACSVSQEPLRCLSLRGTARQLRPPYNRYKR